MKPETCTVKTLSLLESGNPGAYAVTDPRSKG